MVCRTSTGSDDHRRTEKGCRCEVSAAVGLLPRQSGTITWVLEVARSATFAGPHGRSPAPRWALSGSAARPERRAMQQSLGAQPQQAARLGAAEVLDVVRRAAVEIVDHRALARDRAAGAPGWGQKEGSGSGLGLGLGLGLG